MSPARIRTRRTKSGEPRYLVVYRLGGRAFKDIAGGTFTTLKDARARRDFISGEIAAGRDPRKALERMRVEQQPRRSFAEVGDAMLASRRDWKPNTARRVRQQLNRLNKTFGQHDPALITVDEVDAWITSELAQVKASTLLVARHTLRQVLDHAGVEPNPARSPRLHWPRDDREDGNPPSAEHVLLIAKHIRLDALPLFLFLERTGARLGEALTVSYADIDYTAGRVRLVKTKTGRDRWAQVPGFLIDTWRAMPHDDRRGPLFPMHENTVRKLIARACDDAGIPHYTPHDLRHRRGTIWHHDGVVAREIAHRLGHSSTRETLDTYSHVVPPGEITDLVLADLVRTRCGQEGD